MLKLCLPIPPGMVTDAEVRDAFLADAEVFVDNSSFSVRTDSLGLYQTFLPPGTHRVVAVKEG